MVVATVAIRWLCAEFGYAGALRLDASIAGAMGLVAGVCLAATSVLAPRHGLLARRLQARRTHRYQIAALEGPPTS